MNKILLRASLLALSCSLSITALAQNKPTSTLSVPAGDLASSLESLRKQAGLEIIYNASELKGARSKQLQGNYSSEEALTRLLDGSGFTLTVDSSGAYAIVKHPPAPKKPTLKPKADAGAGLNVPDERGADIATLPEILVKGSRSLNADIARTEDDIQPYVVFSREDIDLSTASNVEEFLNNRLPMNQSRGTMSRNTPEGDAGNRSSFNLRGLGTNQTLILINGRRAPGVSTLLTTGDLGQPDLNGVPLSAIERIEVLPTTASGIYGGGATGGVINIVLRKDYVGSEIRLAYDNTFDTDSARRKVEFSSGFALQNGRTNVMFSGSYSDGNDILVRDRDFAIRGRRLMQQNYKEGLHGVLGRQTNVFGFSDLVLDNGTAIGSPYTSVPAGYVGGDGGLGMVGAAGYTDIEVPDTIAGGRQSLSAVPKVTSFGVTLRHQFSDSIDGYLDLGSYRNEGTNKFSGAGAVVYLAGDAPGNPFNDDVYVSVPYYGKELERSSVGISETERINSGFTFKLPRKWSAGIDFSKNISTNKNHQDPGTLDGYAIVADIASGALDVFRDLLMYPIDLSPYAAATKQGYGPGKGILTEYSVRAGGPVVDLPAGEMRITAQVSSRKEEAGDAVSVYTSNYLGESAQYSSTTYRYLPSRYQKVESFYVEATTPLVAASQSVPFIYSLDTQATFRRDEYTTVSVSPGLYLESDQPTGPFPQFSRQSSETKSNDFSAGFKYKPIEELAVRASYGTGFLPPSLAQISDTQFGDEYAFLADPLRGNVRTLIGPYSRAAGGSDSVKPERSKSISAGLIYTPNFAPTLRLSVDYTRIGKTDEITRLSSQQILNLEQYLPGRVVRGANLPGDPAGYAGVITAIDTTLFNTASSKMEAWDFQIEHELDLGSWGRLQTYGVATLQTSLESQTVVSEPTVERVGFQDGPLRWRGNAGFVWKSGAWTTSLNTQWYDSYKVYSSYDFPYIQEVTAQAQGSDRVESQNYTDVSTRYTFATGFFEGMWVSAGIRNVFGTSPPTIATSDSRGGYSTYADPRGRTYVVSLQKTF